MKHKMVGIRSAVIAGVIFVMTFVGAVGMKAQEVALETWVSVTSSTVDGNKLFYFDVPEGFEVVDIFTSGTSGDVLDMAVNLPSTGGYPLSTAEADAAAVTFSGDETIVFSGTPAEAGTYYILVEKYGSGGNFTITAHYSNPNKIFLGDGEINEQSVSADNPQITVRQGEAIYGHFDVLVHNAMGANAIAPVVGTPNWGDPQTSYWGINEWIGTGDIVQSVTLPDGMTAPSEPGTYYILVAMGGTYDYEQILTGTHAGFPADWVNGNILAYRPTEEFETAMVQGWINFKFYKPDAPGSFVHAQQALAAIRVNVVEPLPAATLTLDCNLPEGLSYIEWSDFTTGMQGSELGSYQFAQGDTISVWFDALPGYVASGFDVEGDVTIHYQDSSYIEFVLDGDATIIALIEGVTATKYYTETSEPNAFMNAGTAQVWYADDATWFYELPFEFSFYGTPYTSVYVSSNGFLDFKNEASDCYNSDEGLVWNARIAPLWYDLRTDTGDIFITEEADSVTFRWMGTTYGDGSPVNFEAVLYADGRIKFNYGNGNSGFTPTVGLSSGDGVLYDFATANGNSDFNNVDSILFTPSGSTNTAVATFAVSPDGAGTITPSGAVNLIKGTLYDIQAIPNLGYAFNGWTASPQGNAVFGDANLSATNIKISDDVDVTANFVANGYKISFVCNDNTFGKIDGQATQYATSCDQIAPVTAVPMNSTFSFLEWRLEGSEKTFSKNNPFPKAGEDIFEITGDMTFVAVFFPRSVMVYFTSGTGGTLGPSYALEQEVEYGLATLEVTATASEGYRFKAWNGNYDKEEPVITTIDVSTSKIQLKKVLYETYIEAQFVSIFANLTMATNPSGAGITNPPEGQSTVKAGEEFDISVEPAKFYTFEMWEAYPPENASIVDRLNLSTKATIFGDAVITARLIPDPIRVVYPNGIGKDFEKFIVGSMENLQWTGGPKAQNVKLEYSPDLGKTWSLIVDSTPNVGSYVWTVPEIPKDTTFVAKAGEERLHLPAAASQPISTVYNQALAKAKTSNLKKSPSKNDSFITIYRYGFEDGLGNWTQSVEKGKTEWNVVDSSIQDIKILNPQINPTLVALPDEGRLPSAIEGKKMAWFGNANTGTFIGEFVPELQVNNNGGKSTTSQRGNLDSPLITLSSDLKFVYLTFQTWWECEGVDIANGQYDQMRVMVSTDGGANYTLLGTINPLNDANGESFRPFTTSGLGVPGEWVSPAFDLTAYKGQTVKIRFQFDSVDALYNGFRGWIIDNVVVGGGSPWNPPEITEVVPAKGFPGDVISIMGNNFMSGATVLLETKTVQSAVISQNEIQFIAPAGMDYDKWYDIKVTNPDTQTGLKEDCFMIIDPIHRPNIDSITPSQGMQNEEIDVVIKGGNFDADATVTIAGVTLLNIKRLDANTITATTPTGLPVGFQNVEVINPSIPSTALLPGGFRVIKSTTDMWLVRVSDVNDPSATDSSDEGFTVTTGTVYTLTFSSVDDAKGSVDGIKTQKIATGGKSIPVLAIPKQDYIFEKWTNGDADLSTDNPLVITNVSSNMDVKAHFKSNTFSVIFHSAFGGTIGGKTVQEVPAGGSTTPVTAIPNPGYIFYKWTDDYNGMENPLTITNVVSNMVITPIFVPSSAKLTMGLSPEAGGTVTPPAGENMVDTGKDIEVVAIPADFYEFKTWSADKTSAIFGDVLSATTKLKIFENTKVTAIFVPAKKSITVKYPNGGEKLYAETTETIEWTSTGTVTNVKLEYSSDLGASWKTIVDGEINDGNYNWTVPSPVPSAKSSIAPERKALPAASAVKVPTSVKKATAAAKKAALANKKAQALNKAGVALYKYGFEDGFGEWIAQAPQSGITVWNVVDNSQDISIKNPEINPDLVSLPDQGVLPDAVEGTKAAWFGAADNGTFLGEYNSYFQYPKNGGTSTAIQRASLDSPQIYLYGGVGGLSYYLTFQTWWEVEGVDIADGQYDQMRVYVSTDSGATYQKIGTINPLNDVDGEFFRPYTTGGLGEPGVWVPVTFDLSQYADQYIKIRFEFDTVDHLYNGFRGWLIDDVQVTSSNVVKPPVITTLVPNVGVPGDLISIIGENFVNGAKIMLNGKQVKSSVISENEAQFTIPYLEPGDYEVSLANPDGQSAISPIPLTILKDTPPSIYYVDPNYGMNDVVTPITINGANFVTGAKAYIAGTELADIEFISTYQIKAKVPTGLPVGFQNVEVVNPNGLAAFLMGGFEVKGVVSTSPWLVRVTDSSDPTVSDQSDAGFDVIICPDGVSKLNLVASPATGGTTKPEGNIVVANKIAKAIKATPAAHFSFTGWTAEPAGNATFADASKPDTTVTLTGDATVTANFKADTAILTVKLDPEKGGTAKPDTGEQQIGIPIEIEATPAKGYYFSKWTSDEKATIVEANSAKTTVTISGDATITAVFTKGLPDANFNLTMAVNDPNMGSTLPGAGEKIPIKAQTPYKILATPEDPPAGAKGYYFVGWTADTPAAVIEDSSLWVTTVTLYDNATVTANFAVIPAKAKLTMAVEPSYAGGTKPEEGKTAEYDTLTDIDISAKASKGWYFVRWAVNGYANIDMIFSSKAKAQLLSDATITAVFSDKEPKSAKVTFKTIPEDGSGGKTNPAGEYPVNMVDSTNDGVDNPSAEFYVLAVPNEGYAFKKWSVDGNAALVNTALEETLATVTGDCTITAEFTSESGSKGVIKSASITSIHSEFVSKEQDDGETYYEQHSKDKYSITFKFDLSAMSESDYNSINKDTEIAFTLGSLYDISNATELGIDTLGDLNADPTKYKQDKGGSISRSFKDYDYKGKEKTVEKITFKWSNVKKKELIVMVVGTPLQDEEYNILDLFDDIQYPIGKISGKVSGVKLVFGSFVLSDPEYTISYSGKKGLKSVEKGGEDFDLTSWTVKGKK